MRLPKVFPSRIMAPVVIMLSTSLVAVPAFMRVEPVTTSGPVRGRIRMSTASSVSWGGGEQATRAVAALTTRRMLERTSHVWRGPGGGDADDEITGADAVRR